MKTIIATLLILVLQGALPIYAQGLRNLADREAFEKLLAEKAHEITSIQSTFTQEKYLDVFDEKITSHGTFYYRKSNKIRMQYDKPMDYLIVINGDRLKIVSDGKKSIMKLGNNAMMNQMQGMITACMVGDLKRLGTDYAMEYMESDGQYLVRIRPKSEAVRAYLSGIDIYLNKKDLSVDRLRLSEAGENYTEYSFDDKRFNTLTTDESKFAVN